MIAYKIGGPEFKIESDTATIQLGHAARRKVGEPFAEALDELGIFRDIQIFTTNQLASKLGRVARDEVIGKSIAFPHSIAFSRLPNALQVVAFNPGEPVPASESFIRAQLITQDEIPKEPRTVVPTAVDLALAGLELAKNLRTSFNTMMMLNKGYSSTDDMINRVASGDFPAGSVVVHSLADAFGFPSIENMERLSANGVAAFLVDDSFHNDYLFRPNQLVASLPEIFES